MGITHGIVLAVTILAIKLGPILYKNDPQWKLQAWRVFCTFSGAVAFYGAFYLP